MHPNDDKAKTLPKVAYLIFRVQVLYVKVFESTLFSIFYWFCVYYFILKMLFAKSVLSSLLILGYFFVHKFSSVVLNK